MAVSLSDVLNALNSLKEWLRLKRLPEEVEALTKRVEALERQLAAQQANARTPGAPECPRCHVAMAFQSERPSPTPFGALGLKERIWLCAPCGFSSSTEVPMY